MGRSAGACGRWLRRPYGDGRGQAAAPVFGAASTFGSGAGFAGFAGADAAKKDAPAKEEAGEEAAGPEAEEDCQAEFKPLVQLQEVETVSGEEAETVLLD